ncbi:MAG: trypsin-like peptidase domain-containing protein [Acidobacteriota bacterium]|nr:trypsin-like peptidase domain-containing protein [Acidobacteriota bacterium]
MLRTRLSEVDLFERDLFGTSHLGRRRARGYGETDETDEGEALYYGEAGEDFQIQETPQGTDDRVQVLARATNPSTTLFPFNTICHVAISGGGHGSGTLIAPRVVLTAGHVPQGAASVTVTPGANFPAATAAQQRPATPGSQVSSAFHFHPSLDLALVIMPAAFTRPTQFMMLQPRGDLNTATLLTIAGYPGAIPPPATAPIPGSMWRHSDRLRLTNVTPTHLTYPIDTTAGQSGSPLWLLGNDGIRLLLGVHIQGGSTANTGVRITCAVIDWIEATCRANSITPLPIVDGVQRRRVCPPKP